MIYYEVKATYVKDAGDGKMKSTKEVYLVRALNYADAESRMVETLSHYSHEGMPEVEIKKVKYVDIFDSCCQYQRRIAALGEEPQRYGF